jgi:hypothetical protein
MYKKERVAVLEWTESLSDLDPKEAFEGLQELCREGGVTCSASENLKRILASSASEELIDRAVWLYTKYIEITARQDSMYKLAGALADATGENWEISRPKSER